MRLLGKIHSATAPLNIKKNKKKNKNKVENPLQ